MSYALLLTLLLQVPTNWPGIAAGVVIAAFGFFLVRLISQIDKKLDANCEAVNRITVDLQGYKMLVDHLKAENGQLHTKVDSLSNSFASFDKYIAVQQALQAKPSTN